MAKKSEAQRIVEQVKASFPGADFIAGVGWCGPQWQLATRYEATLRHKCYTTQARYNAAADILATEAACYAKPVENTWNRPECPGDIGTMGHLKGGF